MSMRPLAVSLVLLVAVAAPQQRYFSYERPLAAPLAQSAQTCVVLDAGIFAHTAPGLADLRLYRDAEETPYAIDTEAETETASQTVPLLNAGVRSGKTVFDAQMLDGPYSDLQLNIERHNFIATVTVTGSRDTAESSFTTLGNFTIFDFTRERLGRSTALHLPQSNFPVLHFRIAGPVMPGDITGISVTHVSERKPDYLTIAETTHAEVKDHGSQFEFTVPAQVPVDRVVFVPAAQPAQFSRPVNVRVAPVAAMGESDRQTAYSIGTFGNLLRIHSVHNGHRIDEEKLEVDATRVGMSREARWTIRVENGDDVPIFFKSVRLEMRQRKMCFDGAAGARYALYYGDAALLAPRYDYATLFVAQDDAQQAQLGAEVQNASHVARPDMRPFTERYPVLLWIALLAVVALLVVIAISSLKHQKTRPGS